jgi:[ribosomal protein S5]-alanine N-acetyltransferase
VADVMALGPVRIESAKVRLQRFTAEDLTPQYLGWLNDAVTMRYSNQRFRRHTRESSLAYLQSFDGTPNLFLSIRRRSDGLALGTMTAYLAEPHGTADMGILIGERACWGQGYGLDAWQALLDWLLRDRGLRKVTAGTLECNAAMLRLMEKSGMHHEGSRRQQEIVEGVAYDILYFARFGDD